MHTDTNSNGTSTEKDYRDDDDVTRSTMPNGVVIACSYEIRFIRASQLDAPDGASDQEVRDAIADVEDADADR